MHLSPGAIAGIVLLAVGTIVGLLVIFGVTAYCYLKSKFDRVRKEGRIEGKLALMTIVMMLILLL